jgi:hypothetical protein
MNSFHKIWPTPFGRTHHGADERRLGLDSARRNRHVGLGRDDSETLAVEFVVGFKDAYSSKHVYDRD